MRRHPTNPFLTHCYNGQWAGDVCAQDRLQAVRGFDLEQCRSALRVAGLQKSVRMALERRLRKLERPR